MNLSPYESTLYWYAFWAKEFNCSIKEIDDLELEYLFDLTITKVKTWYQPKEKDYIDELWK